MRVGLAVLFLQRSANDRRAFPLRFKFVCRRLTSPQDTMASTSRSILALRRAQRAYATIANDAAATKAAQASSAALKIKEKRSQTEAAFAKTSEAERSLTLTEKRAFVRPEVQRDSARSRLRGVRTVRHSDGSTGEQIMGQRIYLPNIIFTLVHNHTPPGKAYNPYEATFRIPQNITKTDVRSYLHAIYGVECTYIRTDNYLVPMKHQKAIAMGRAIDRGQKRAYKRAVVGLKEPFYYPQMVEDMNGRDRWLREQDLEDSFRLKEFKEISKAMSVKGDRSLRENNASKLAAVWNTKKQVYRKLWEQREAREKKTKEIAKELEEML